MQEEYEALMINNTWELVNPPLIVLSLVVFGCLKPNPSLIRPLIGIKSKGSCAMMFLKILGRLH